MAQLQSWSYFQLAVDNMHQTRSDASSTDRDIILGMAHAQQQYMDATRQAFQQILDRIERLHQKVDRLTR
ncbi:MAG TPA: hypothetical protein VGX03_22995 [Candidatus Binatia bacterium]|jgi:hypothetical protein|nr:hypothetical protein [Candidatus Binatia bacterium]